MVKSSRKIMHHEKCPTHAKGDGGHNNLEHPAAPLVLHLDALLGRHARMIVAGCNLPLILHAQAPLTSIPIQHSHNMHISMRDHSRY